MYICPDCDYFRGPEYPQTLSDRDYDSYDTNIEKTRQGRRQLKEKYSRREIKEMKKAIIVKIDSLKSSYATEERNLYNEWDVLKKSVVIQT